MAIAHDDDAVEAAADRLLAAARSGSPCLPVRDLIGSEDLAAAYAVQSRITQVRLTSGARAVGRKIGLTSPAVQQQLGVDQPDFGFLFDDMGYASGDALPLGAVLQPRVEAEIAFLLRSDLSEGPLDYDEIRDAVEYAVPALEVCGSRITGWDITFGDTVADNASSGAFVLGTERKGLDAFEPKDVTMAMTIDGVTVSTGDGAACLGDPLLALQWLARTARALGDPLRLGEIVLTGALGPMRPVTPGCSVSATIDGLGSVRADFAE